MHKEIFCLVRAGEKTGRGVTEVRASLGKTRLIS